MSSASDGEDEMVFSCLHKQVGGIADGVAVFAAKLGADLSDIQDNVATRFEAFYCKIFVSENCSFHM